MAFAMRLCVFFIVATTAMAATCLAHAGQIDGLLARMRAAAGAPYGVHLRSALHADEDGTLRATVIDALGDVSFSQTCVQSLCSGVYFDGASSYRVDFNQTALPEPQLGSPLARSARVVESLAFLSPTFRGTIRDAGPATLDGHACRVLLITPRGGSTIATTVNLQTALIASLADARNRADATFFGDYRRVASLTLPFSVRKGSAIARYDSREVESGPFVPPAGLNVRVTDEAPMRADAAHITPVGPCAIGGVAARCLIDTGNSGMSVSLQLAERLKLTVVGGGDAFGLGGYATEVVRAGPLHVGNAIVATANYTVLPGIDRYGYDVVVGTDALAATRVLLDPTAHLVRFGAPTSKDATIVPLSFADFAPVVEVRLGDVVAQLLFDTGDESGIDLSSEFYAAHPDAFVPTQERAVAGVGGSSVQLLGRVPYVAIAGLTLRDQPIGTTHALGGPADGRLGEAFLRRFSVVLDYAAERVEFVENSAALPKELARPGVVSITP